ncbi:MAG: TonB-dependent receptor plug domain-containing protein, partial [Polymorphobacter sp.]
MSLILIALAAVTADPSIVVTASRTPVALDLSGASIAVIDRTTLTAFDLPLAADYLRLVPSVAVASTGPLGAQTQVRIRGAEASQTLTFIDGIKANDPASGGEFRWETLLADGLDKVEVLRGPQSALWGSEAIGGVVNVITRAPTAGSALYGTAEAGSFGTWNLSGGGNWGTDQGGVTGQLAYLDSAGIDTSDSGGGANGDKDGFNNFTATGKALYRPSTNSEVGLVLRYVDATTNFDGFDYSIGQSADEPLSSSSRAFAVRGYAKLDLYDGRWSNQIEGVLNDTSNKNYDNAVFLNQSDGSVGKLAYQTTGTLQSGDVSHVLTGAVEYERQTFTSTDADPTALSNQDRSRDQTSLIADYRLTYAQIFSASASVRHDINSEYANMTTFRTTAALALPQGFRAHASFGEGVSDPSFFDLYGFFPDYFIGNPNLVPETSSGWDVGIGWKSTQFAVDLTWFDTNLTNEIVSTYDFATGISGVAHASG